VTIDGAEWPYTVLSVRGDASVEMLDGVSPEYAASAVRYFGEEGAAAWLAQLGGRGMGRISIQPSWVGVLDFQSRFPRAFST